ncbi:MAG TPA: amylo-alpha-1,6-glucosidase [Kiloniellales bacterium]|jgi:glycogen debranching enzyme|nr:amylo-alpha-1,6-glucosidase [Kiloniellales bacterium]
MELASPKEETGAWSETHDAFEITASSSLPERRLSTLKQGDTFGLFNPDGDIAPGPGSPEGLYHQDCRHLSGMELAIEGRHPLLLSSTLQDDNVVLTVDLTNPDIFDGDDLQIGQDTLHILRSRFILNGRLYERIRLENFGDISHSFEVSLRMAADFVDLFEVRGHKRERRGRSASTVVGDRLVAFDYRALDGRALRTLIEFDPAPTRLSSKLASYRLTLKPRQRKSLFLICTCGATPVEEPASRAFFIGYRDSCRTLRESTANAATVESSNEIFNEVLCRSMADLYMLNTSTEEGPYPYAGTPWFSTVFGRDGIITALQMLWIDPSLARGVLKFLARNQATDLEPKADAEPGKILHELRQGEMARLGEVPFRRYYGSVDSTPLFIMLAGRYFRRTGDRKTMADLWPNIEAALRWIDDYGDIDGDGLIKYARKEAAGLYNQGWKDSYDSVYHADGSCARLPIALCEVQGYVFAARQEAAAIARALGHEARASELDQQAERLRQLVEERFWCNELGFYAIALDGDGKPCRVRSSNAGHLLFCRLPSPERARKVADALLDATFFSGWGIRTIASNEPRYSPISYHNGSIWPHDNALIALGLARYGLEGHVLKLFKGLFDTAAAMDLRRLPELFCGFKRQPGNRPTSYPVACSPQAWASAMPFALLQASLGVHFDAGEHTVLLERPSLPSFIDELLIRSLRLADGEVDLLLSRHQTGVTTRVLKREGPIKVLVTLD